MASDWYFQIMGEVSGPVTPTELRRLVAEERIDADTLVKRGTEGEWLLAGRVRGLFANITSGGVASNGSNPPSEKEAGGPEVREQLHLREKSIVVTDRTISFGARKTYVIGHLVSVERGEEPPNTLLAKILIIVGALISVGSLADVAFGQAAPAAGGESWGSSILGLLLGVLLIGLGVYLMSLRRSRPWTRLSFSSGERELVTDDDPFFIDRFAAAILEAID